MWLIVTTIMDQDARNHRANAGIIISAGALVAAVLLAGMGGNILL